MNPQEYLNKWHPSASFSSDEARQEHLEDFQCLVSHISAVARGEEPIPYVRKQTGPSGVEMVCVQQMTAPLPEGVLGFVAPKTMEVVQHDQDGNVVKKYTVVAPPLDPLNMPFIPLQTTGAPLSLIEIAGERAGVMAAHEVDPANAIAVLTRVMEVWSTFKPVVGPRREEAFEEWLTENIDRLRGKESMPMPTDPHGFDKDGNKCECEKKRACFQCGEIHEKSYSVCNPVAEMEEVEQAVILQAVRDECIALRSILRTVTQQIHQAYHTEHYGTWQTCPKSTCRLVADELRVDPQE